MNTTDSPGGPVERIVSRQREIIKGIEAYSREQQVIVRLLRKRGAFTDSEFDRWFSGRELRRPRFFKRASITGDSFILGMGRNGGTLWAFYLDLIQHMMAAGIVNCVKAGRTYTYTLVANAALSGCDAKE